MVNKNNPKLRLTLAITLAILSSQSLYAGDVEISLPAASDAFTVDQPAGTELMRVNGDGNVGIGTATPEKILHVKNNSFSYMQRDNGTNTDARTPLYLAHTSDVDAGADGIGTRLVFGAETKTEGLVENLGYFEYITTDATAGSIDADLGMVLYRDGASFTALFAESSGNVGVGTRTPEATLDVTGDVLANDSVLVDGTTDAGLASIYARQQSTAQDGAARAVVRTATAGAAFQLYEANSTGDAVTGVPKANLLALNSWGATGVDNLLIGTGTAPIHFYNGNPVGSVKMSILPAGNVGIGTMAPRSDAKLTLEDGVGSGWESRYEFRNGYAWQTVASDSPTGGEPRFMFARNRGTLATPTANQDGDLMGQLEFRAYDGGVHRRGASILGQIDGTVSASNMPAALYFRTEAEGGSDLENRMVIKNDGKVGIGTIEPTTTLHVTDANGSAQIDNGNLYLNFTDDNILVDPTTGATISDPGMAKGIYVTNNSTIKGTGAMLRLSSSITGGAAAGLIGRSADPTRTGRASLDMWTEDPDGTRLPRMTVNYDGKVGIGTTIPVQPLEMASGAHVTSAGVWTNASDVSKKKNIKAINYGLETVMKLKPSEYDYKVDGSHSIGFIAQEIEKIIPEVVSGEEGSKGVSYGSLTAVLVKALQQQQAQIESQQKRIQALEAK